MTPHTKLQKIIHGIIKTIALAMKVDDEIRSSDGDTDWEKEICKTAISTFLHCAFLNEDGKWQYGDGDKDWVEEWMKTAFMIRDSPNLLRCE